MERMEIKQESSDDRLNISSLNNIVTHQENSKESSVQSTYSSITHMTEPVSITTQPQPSQHSVPHCTKVKKDEEGGEIKLEWDGDECDCEECRVDREIKIEFNQTNATGNAQGSSYVWSSETEIVGVCKGVKKEEEDEDGTIRKTIQSCTKANKEESGEYIDEWDEDCDCCQCRRMRLKAIQLKQTIPIENQQTNPSELRNDDKGADGDDVEENGEGDGEETEVDENQGGNDEQLEGDSQVSDEECENTEIRRELDEEVDKSEVDHEHGYDGQIGDQSDDDETEIDDEEYEMDVDGEESSDDQETEVDEQSDREVHHQSNRKNNVCQHCGKKFRNSAKLTMHIRTHTGERPFKCPWEKCEMAFAQKYNMQMHYKTHTGERPFKCHWKRCNKTFALKCNMLAHYKTHTGEGSKRVRSHICEHCGKGYPSLYSLTTHIRTHTGERPFMCPWKRCKKTFTQKCHIKLHYKTHTGERPFKCPWKRCDKTFAEECKMQAHYKAHTVPKPHICEHCGTRWRSLSSLTIHIRTHTGERPFKCTWKDCDKAFAQVAKLNVHLCTHTGGPPYKCSSDNCGEAFVTKRQLEKHRQATHSVSCTMKKIII